MSGSSVSVSSQNKRFTSKYRPVETWGSRHLRDLYFSPAHCYIGNGRIQTQLGQTPDYACPHKPRHPADKALYVRRACTRRPAAETNVQPVKRQGKILYPQVCGRACFEA